MNEVSPYTITRTQPPGLQPFHPAGGHFSEELNLKEYWRIVKKHQTLIGALVVTASVLIVAWRLTSVPLYKAVSVIMIQPAAPQVLADVKELVTEQGGNNEYDYYGTQFDIMKSRSLAARVISEYNLEHTSLFAPPQRPSGLIGVAVSNLQAWVGSLFASSTRTVDDDTGQTYGVRPELIQSYLSRLSVEPRKGTRLVAVGFTSADPALSARIADAHVQTFIRQGLDLHAQTGKNVQEFLRHKLAELKDQVEKSEAALNAYRRSRGIVALDESDSEGGSKGDPLAQRMAELNTELTNASEKRIVLETQHQLIAKGDYESLPAVINDPVIQNLKEQLVQLSTQYASMSNRFNPGYHPLDDLKARLDETSRRLDEQVRGIDESVEADYRAALANEAKLATELQEVKSQAMARNDSSLQEAVLERNVQTSRELYKAVMQRVNEISVSSNVPTSNVSVVDPAAPPKQRVGPSLLEFLLFGCTAAGLCGVGMAFFLESFDESLKTPEEAARWLGFPSLGVVPDFAKVNNHGYAAHYVPYRSRRENAPPAEVARPAVPDGPREVLVSRGDFSTISEAYRTIRAAVMFSKAGGAPKTILITSATVAEGKTATSVNIAAAFAHTGSRTLIIDTDLRRARCHEIFGLDTGQGLSEVLVGQRQFQEVVFATKVPQLWVLGAGSLPPNPSELLASPEMRKLIQLLAENYDYVILDSAPVMPVSDTLGICSMVEGVLIVADSTVSKRIVRDACSRLSQVGARILGVILNRVEVDGKSRYGDHYGYYHSYKPREDRGGNPAAPSA